MDTVFLGYFASHIPITLLVDLMPLLPAAAIPRPLLHLNQFLTGTLRDPLMVIEPRRPDLLWLHSFLVCELVLQVPFFFYAVWALWTANPRRHLPFLVYGAHVSTTVVPILATLLFGDIDRSASERLVLVGLYAPYLAIPLAITYTSFAACTRALSAAHPLKAKTA
ncbi:Transmembrane protein 97 [Coemansia sp. RSA 552]|nr:Transmembrane protein 97 [Coemansia sp. RSA 552]